MKSIVLKWVHLIICFVIICFSKASAQTNFQWAKRMGGNQGDYGKAITVDISGNVYTTGTFMGTVDFDPGPGVYNLTAFGNRDAFISKLDANGNFIWAKQFGGTNASISGNSLITDALGNVLLTGEFMGSADFDPGSGVFNLTNLSNYDVFISKLDPSGNFVWAKQIGGNQSDEVYSIASDNSNNVYVTGWFAGTVDFDPNASTYTLTAPGGFILKLTGAGNFGMAKLVTEGGSTTPLSIKVDAAGNIYTSGAFAGNNVDFDTGSTTYTLTGFGGADAFIQKIDNSGNFIWAQQLGGPGSEQGTALCVDGSGNVFSTGYFQGTADFDPGASTYTMTSVGAANLDVYVSKLSPSGNFIWAKQLGGNQQDTPSAIFLDNLSNVYTTGGFQGTGDFDPSASTYTLNSIGGTAVFISKLDPLGNFVWANGFGYSNSLGRGIAVTPYYEIYTTGNYDQTTDFDPSASTYTLIGNGNDDVFVHKLGQPGCPTFSINSSTNSYTLMCSLNTLTLNAVNTTTYTGVTYTWTAPSSATTTGSSYTLSAGGIYTVNASVASNTCIVTQLVSIIQSTGNVNFNINTNGSICNNNGSASVTVTSGTSPYTYTWSAGGTATSVSSLAPGNYTVKVTDANLCSLTQSFSIINSAPAFSSVPICFVTVDSLSQYNVITWDKNLFPTADSFFVYRETGTNLYQVIRKQPFSALSKFVDTVKTLYFPNTGNPNVGTYRYKIKTKDNCSNLSSFSPYHNTLFMVNNNGTFSWTQLYAIEGDPNPVSAYILERDNFSTNNWQAVGSVAGTQQFIIDPDYATYQSTGSWRVRTQWSISCIPSRSSLPTTSSYSNRITTSNVGLNENAIDNYLTIYPNPNKGIVNIKLKSGSSILKEYLLEIRNVIGEKIYTKQGESFNELQINLADYSNGVYFVTFKTESKTTTGKIIITK